MGWNGPMPEAKPRLCQCQHCGYQRREMGLYCPKCGGDLNRPVAPPAPPPPRRVSTALPADFPVTMKMVEDGKITPAEARKRMGVSEAAIRWSYEDPSPGAMTVKPARRGRRNQNGNF